jgi:hypothetical protein
MVRPEAPGDEPGANCTAIGAASAPISIYELHRCVEVPGGPSGAGEARTGRMPWLATD